MLIKSRSLQLIHQQCRLFLTPILLSLKESFYLYSCFIKQLPKQNLSQHQNTHLSYNSLIMHAEETNKYKQSNEDEYSYQSQEFQTIPENSYASKVDKLFTINYNKSTYENIQFSANEMRNMMKDVSKILDQKIHKYYGLMGIKIQPQHKDVNILIEKLKMEQEANNKLIKTQISEINDIELVDQQMASSKRVEKQAQRLRQYFETKKLMLQSDKYTRYSKGQISKAGQCLARDLDVDKHYFRLNNIKQDLQYAILRDREQTKKSYQLQIKLRELQKKHDIMNKLYNQKVNIAQNNQIQVEENQSFFKECQSKRQLLKRKQEIKKKTEISNYNLQSFLLKLQNQIQNLRRFSTEQSQKISFFENKVINIQKEINTMKQKTDLNKKMEQSMSIKNIQTLLKNKKDKYIFTSIQNKSQIHQSLEKNNNSTSQLMQSSILLKPNFKIKQHLTPSKSKLSPRNSINKSMDFSKKYSNANGLQQLLQRIPQTKIPSYDKRILKWTPSNRKKTTQSPKKSFLQEKHRMQSENPQN